jgi:hypothetical protein
MSLYLRTAGPTSGPIDVQVFLIYKKVVKINSIKKKPFNAFSLNLNYTNPANFSEKLEIKNLRGSKGFRASTP